MDEPDEAVTGNHTAAADADVAPTTGSFLPGCRFIIGATLILSVMLLLCSILWKRVRQVDPLQRCSTAYKSSYTAVDTTLVDRIRVRTPQGDGRTTCGQLREAGRVNHVPPREKKRPFE
ncbi:MAG: hypothetical protein ABIS27_06840 [Longimicrobiales bacterium]